MILAAGWGNYISDLMKICFVCVSLRPGGTERIVSRMANHLVRKYHVTLVTLAATATFYPVAPKVEVVKPTFGARSSEGFGWYGRLLRYLRLTFRKAKPDLVLCFGESIAPLVLPLSRLANARVLVFNRASPITSLRGMRGWINPIIYPLAHKVVVQTHASVELLRHRYRGCRFHVLPNPIDVPAEVLPMSCRDRVIINVGSLGGHKNQQGLIRAFGALNLNKRWRLDFVGDGPDRTRLEVLSESLGLVDRVRFLGKRDDVGKLLQQARIFAFSSLTEGFPNALAEALSAGCACLSYDCPTGPRELIADGVNGLLVPNNDEKAFQTALARLAKSGERQAQLGRAARQRILEFDQNRVLAHLDALVESTLAA